VSENINFPALRNLTTQGSNVIPLFKTEEPEIEYALLGILISHNSLYFDIHKITRQEHFADEFNAHLFGLLKARIENGEACDTALLSSFLTGNEDQKKTQRERLIQISTSFVAASSLSSYAKRLRELYLERRTQIVLSQSISGLDKAKELTEIIYEAAANESGFISLAQALVPTLDRIDRAHKQGSALFSLRTGLTKLDDMLCGLEPGGLYVIAGRPAMGKTALGLTIASNVARRNETVLFFSLEMSHEQLCNRLLARYAEVSMYEQRNGLPQNNYMQLHFASENLNKTPLFIEDKSGVTAQDIAASCHQFLRRHGKPKLIVIDHLAIVGARDQKLPRVYQIAEMTAAFKKLAKDLQVPVLLLHQLNRAVEGRDDKRPSLSDLRDGGSVEQDADAVMLLYRAEYYLQNREPKYNTETGQGVKNWQEWNSDYEKSKGCAQLIIAKNRQGVTASIPLLFDGTKQFFDNPS
jgi:replicative DNA helicase